MKMLLKAVLCAILVLSVMVGFCACGNKLAAGEYQIAGFAYTERVEGEGYKMDRSAMESWGIFDDCDRVYLDLKRNGTGTFYTDENTYAVTCDSEKIRFEGLGRDCPYEFGDGWIRVEMKDYWHHTSASYECIVIFATDAVCERLEENWAHQRK